jgi:hypothetical protein
LDGYIYPSLTSSEFRGIEVPTGNLSADTRYFLLRKLEESVQADMDGLVLEKELGETAP